MVTLRRIAPKWDGAVLVRAQPRVACAQIHLASSSQTNTVAINVQAATLCRGRIPDLTCASDVPCWPRQPCPRVVRHGYRILVGLLREEYRCGEWAWGGRGRKCFSEACNWTADLNRTVQSWLQNIVASCWRDAPPTIASRPLENLLGTIWRRLCLTLSSTSQGGVVSE